MSGRHIWNSTPQRAHPIGFHLDDRLAQHLNVRTLADEFTMLLKPHLKTERA